MCILSTRNQVKMNQVDIASSDNPADPYDVDLVIDPDQHNANQPPPPPQPFTGGDGGYDVCVDFG